MPLQADILNADRSSIIDTIKKIKTDYLVDNRWIQDNNRYRKDTINFIKTDSRSRINQKHLREYIASSSILFSCDGWINFSRSIESLLYGDIANSIHLAYYAEIKAVMSILASEGIGVFQNKHYFVNNANRVINVSNHSQTHKFIPEAIIEWANLPKSVELFNNLSFNNHTFSRWFEASPFGIIAAPQLIASSWLKEYSLDLNYIAGDHILRNEMSYRPQNFSIDFSDNIFSTVLSYVKNLWKISEPDGINSFSVLDKHLLRKGIEKLYIAQTSPRRRLDSHAYNRFIRDIFDDLRIPVDGYLFRFMLREIEADDLSLFNNASHGPFRKKNLPDNTFTYYRKNRYYSLNDALGILSRTFILMRFSLSMTAGVLRSSTITKNDLNFWLNDLGTSFGINNNLAGIINLSDLWTSVEESINNIDNLNAAIASPTLFEAHQNSLSNEFKILNQFQRVFFWGLAN